MDMEIWKDIKGYEGIYQVSNYGRIKSFNNRKEVLLSGGNNGKGYLFVGLSKNGKVKNFYIHRLVAQTFIPNHNDLPQVNHKDENKENNCVDNLEWCTRKYNMNYGTLKTRMSNSLTGKKASKKARKKMSDSRKGKRIGAENPYAKSVICLNTNDIYSTIKEASEDTGINYASISKCCHGKSKTAGKNSLTGEKIKWMFYDKWLEDKKAS